MFNFDILIYIILKQYWSNEWNQRCPTKLPHLHFTQKVSQRSRPSTWVSFNTVYELGDSLDFHSSIKHWQILVKTTVEEMFMYTFNVSYSRWGMSGTPQTLLRNVSLTEWRVVSQKLTNCHLWQKSGRVLKVGLGWCNMWAAPPPSPPLKAKRLLPNYGQRSRAVIDLVLRK